MPCHISSGIMILQHIAADLGYECLGELSGFPGHFLLHKVDHDGQAEARHLTLGLTGDLRVLWAEQQFDKVRVKRNSLPAWKTHLGQVYERRVISGELVKNQED